MELPARVAYLEGLNRFLKGESGSLQGVYTLAQAAGREQLDAVIEWDAELAAGKVPKKRFERSLLGFHVGTANALYVVADSGFFLALARERGGEVDRRFFELLDQTFHGSASRIYVNQISDTAACYELGTREFIDSYRGWTQFSPRAPKAYADTVKEEILLLEQVLLTATCACGTQETVQTGFESFLKFFPKSPIAAKVRDRLNKVRSNASDIQFSCEQYLDLGQPIPYGAPTPPPLSTEPDPACPP